MHRVKKKKVQHNKNKIKANRKSFDGDKGACNSRKYQKIEDFNETEKKEKKKYDVNQPKQKRSFFARHISHKF